jgi:uncharacterized protein CbrC (UPF0167 family)
MTRDSGSQVTPAPPAYRYFREPHHYSTYSAAPQTCDLCGQTKSGYKGPFYGEADIDFVSEDCLATGKLSEVAGTTNQGDTEALRSQLMERHPELRPAQIKNLVQELTAELEQRTPHLITWQDFDWPAHCGDYCCFIKLAGKRDLDKLAFDGNGREFYEKHAVDAGVRDIWDDIRADSPKDNSEAYSPEVYMFQCLNCAEYVLLADFD